MNTWRDSPMIREALRERPPGDIAVVICDECGAPTYYNEGSHCTCEHCGADLTGLTEGDAAEILTLADLLDAEAEGPGGMP
jgi:hypothetical protein